MAIKYIFLAAALCGAVTAQAEVHVETECYRRVTSGKDGKLLRMTFRRYVDTDLNKEVGSFVQFDDTKEIIPLVFRKHVATDTDSPALGNYEDFRIEIAGTKVTGEYVFVQSGAGIRQGKYVRYSSNKNRKPVIFHYAGNHDSSCKVNF